MAPYFSSTDSSDFQAAHARRKRIPDFILRIRPIQSVVEMKVASSEKKKPRKRNAPVSVVGDYTVEKILDKRIKNGKAVYLVKWLNYPESDNTWEPLSHFSKSSRYLVDEFEAGKAPRESSKENDAMSGGVNTESRDVAVPNNEVSEEMDTESEHLDVVEPDKGATTEGMDTDNSENLEIAKPRDDSWTKWTPKGVIFVHPDPSSGELLYTVEFEETQQAVLLESNVAREMYPQLIIDYLVTRIKWMRPALLGAGDSRRG